MCILCVIQKWSRRVAMMLPWLVIPLIGLWALSQLLPPAFRFEITSPRLACVFVLLVTLFWYEILMPQLSAWRVRRNARMRERKRFEAIELQKLRKTATRRCRNCLTPYRDQNPGGGRFMCTYCGHISKRPVLDLPVLPGMGLPNASIIKELVGKSGKILNGKVWSDNGWMCGQDWLENGNWVGGSVSGKSNYWRRNGSSFFGGDEDCLAEKSYSGIIIFACRILTSFFLCLRWLWRKIFRISSSDDDDSSDAEHKGLLSKRGENGENFPESRGEKARRKAEEKRQARLEKELLEEEERKQREEVAMLVEERRRLRDEKTEAEKDRGKASSMAREKDSKKEAERRRQERRKEKDKGSSKSNSDVEELEKKSGKDSDKKRDFDRRTDLAKNQTIETAHGFKNATTSNYNRGNTGTRYFDRMRGTILSSSKAFSGGSFFGRGTNNATTMMKDAKPNNFVDHSHISAHRKDICPPERVATRPYMNGDDKSTNRMGHSEPQPGTAPKKSWQQLFTRSPNAPPPSTSNVISRPNSKIQVEPQNPQLSAQSPTTQSFNNPINFGSPFSISTYPNTSSANALGFTPAIEPMFPRVGDGPRDYITEEPERFEDPCYIPDPASLLGPVSASLDMDFGLERPRGLKNVSATSDVNKPSPIESPMSREKHNASGRFSTTPRAQDMDDAPANETGMWQMWNTCPLGQDGLGLVGGPASWILPPELSRSIKDDVVHHQSQTSQRTMASLFTTKEEVRPGTHSPPNNMFLGHGQNGGSFSPVTGSNDSDPWLQKAYFPPLSGGENQFVTRPPTQNEMIYGSPCAGVNRPFEQSSSSSWPNSKDWMVPGTTGEGVASKSAVARPHVGGLFPAQNVQQSLWSFD